MQDSLNPEQKQEFWPPEARPEQEPRAASLPGISVCIVCRNEADRLGPCLESVQWADEILVMDLESQDRSAELAEEHGARVFSRPPHPIVEPLRNELAAAARYEWIFALDPDERAAPGLAEELPRLARQAELDAIVIPRMNFDLGYPPSNPIHRYEGQLRMYRKDRVDWPVIPNALPVVAEERKHHLPQRDELVILHDRNRNIPEALERAVRYAPAQAQSMIDEGQVFSGGDMVSALWMAFHKQFIQGDPWQDGVPGVLRAGILVGYKFYVWAAFWQLSGAKRTPADDRLMRRIGFLVRLSNPFLRLLGLFRRLLGGR
jgi:(heptosyl)LPS beta-1,4-glucosyltransferase